MKLKDVELFKEEVALIQKRGYKFSTHANPAWLFNEKLADLKALMSES